LGANRGGRARATDVRTEFPKDRTEFPTFGQNSPKAGQICAKVGQNSPKVGQTCAKVGQNGPKVRQTCAKVGQNGAKVGQNGAKVGQNGPMLGQTCAKVARRGRATGAGGAMVWGSAYSCQAHLPNRCCRSRGFHSRQSGEQKWILGWRPGRASHRLLQYVKRLFAEARRRARLFPVFRLKWLSCHRPIRNS
jgi:hypothetical protein